jgi:hypothetical protein
MSHAGIRYLGLIKLSLKKKKVLMKFYDVYYIFDRFGVLTC